MLWDRGLWGVFLGGVGGLNSGPERLPGHEPAIKVGGALGLDGKGGLGGNAGVGLGLLLGGGRRSLGLSDHRLGESRCVPGTNQPTQLADGPGLRNAVQFGGDDGSTTGVRF